MNKPKLNTIFSEPETEDEINAIKMRAMEICKVIAHATDEYLERYYVDADGNVDMHPVIAAIGMLHCALVKDNLPQQTRPYVFEQMAFACIQEARAGRRRGSYDGYLEPDWNSIAGIVDYCTKLRLADMKAKENAPTTETPQ